MIRLESHHDVGARSPLKRARQVEVSFDPSKYLLEGPTMASRIIIIKTGSMGILSACWSRTCPR